MVEMVALENLPYFLDKIFLDSFEIVADSSDLVVSSSGIVADSFSVAVDFFEGVVVGVLKFAADVLKVVAVDSYHHQQQNQIKGSMEIGVDACVPRTMLKYKLNI